MAKFRAGKNSRASCDGTVLNMNEYSWTHHGDPLDVTNFESNGLYEGIIGIQSLDWTLRGDWDAAKNPFDDPPGLYPREDGESLVMYTNKTDGKAASMTAYLCSDSTVNSTATGKVGYNAAGKSNGSFSVPTGSV